jgi:hypothetical protein
VSASPLIQTTVEPVAKFAHPVRSAPKALASWFAAPVGLIALVFASTSPPIPKIAEPVAKLVPPIAVASAAHVPVVL